MSRKYYLTMIGVKPDNWQANGDAYKKLLQDMENKDDMFLGRAIKSKMPQYEMLIVIESKDEKTAHKRGSWFLANVPGLSCSNCAHDIYAHKKGGGCTKCDCGGYKGAMYWVKEKESKG